jgi:hypothetical protein
MSSLQVTGLGAVECANPGARPDRSEEAARTKSSQREKAVELSPQSLSKHSNPQNNADSSNIFIYT